MACCLCTLRKPCKRCAILNAQAEAVAAREVEANQRAEQAAQDAAEVHDLAQREAAAHEAALQEASQKAARLARLEGTPPLLP